MFQCRCKGSLSFMTGVGILAICGVLSCSPKISVYVHDKEVREPFEKTFTAKEVDSLKVTATNGEVQVSLAPKDKEEIGIVAEKVVRGEAPEADLRKYLANIHVTAKLVGQTLVVEGKWDGKEPQGISGYVNYHITAPARLKFDLTAQNGEVKVKDMVGGGKIATTNGDVEVKGTKGLQEIHTANGGIHLSSITSEAPLRLTTDNGNIDTKALDVQEVVAQTNNGGIRLEGRATSLNLTSQQGEIDAVLSPQAALKNAKIHSSNGHIGLTLPPQSNANLKATTANGSITFEERGNKQNHESRFEKVLGSGGGLIDLKTDNGEIEVRLK